MSEELERWHYLGGQRHEGYLSDCPTCCEDRRVGGQKFGKATGGPEESLCGEEEDLATGSFREPTEDVKNVAGAGEDQLHAWAQHVRGVGRSRQSAYAEALSLAGMQFVAWRDVFPVTVDAVLVGRGEPPLSPREVQILGWFGDGFAAFLAETQRIAREGGR